MRINKFKQGSVNIFALSALGLALAGCQTEALTEDSEIFPSTELIEITAENMDEVIAAASFENYLDLINAIDFSRYEPVALEKRVNLQDVIDNNNPFGRRLKLNLDCKLEGTVALDSTFDAAIFKLTGSDLSKRPNVVSATIGFSSCEDSAGVILGGSAALETLEGDGRYNAILDSLSLSESGNSSMISGQMFIDVYEAGSASYGSRLKGFYNGDKFLFLDYRIREDHTNDPALASFNYTFASFGLGGAVKVTSIQDIELAEGDENPRAGRMEIAGSNASRIIYDADTGDISTYSVSLNGADPEIRNW